MISDLRWLGLVSMVTIVVAAGIPLLSGPFDWQNSVSNSWTSSHRIWLTLAIVMSLAGTTGCASLAWWVIPHYHLPMLMYAVIALAYVAFMSVAWIPMVNRPGEHSYWHGHFLGGSALATLAVIAMILIVWCGVGVPMATRIVCFAAMVLAAGWPLLFFTPLRRAFLVLEGLIAMTFSVAIVLLLAG
jgi:hypothetical protein